MQATRQWLHSLLAKMWSIKPRKCGKNCDILRENKHNKFLPKNLDHSISDKCQNNTVSEIRLTSQSAGIIDQSHPARITPLL